MAHELTAGGTGHPDAAGPVLLTQEAHDRLAAELAQLTDVRRPELVQRGRRARLFLPPDASTDAVSLAAYDLGIVEQHIEQITEFLARANVIPPPTETSTVQLGSHVTVRYDDGTEEA